MWSSPRSSIDVYGWCPLSVLSFSLFVIDLLYFEAGEIKNSPASSAADQSRLEVVSQMKLGSVHSFDMQFVIAGLFYQIGIVRMSLI